MLEVLITQFAFFMTGYNPGTFMFSQVNVMVLLFKSHKILYFFFSLRQTFLRCRNADCWSRRREREALCGAEGGGPCCNPRPHCASGCIPNLGRHLVPRPEVQL